MFKCNFFIIVCIIDSNCFLIVDAGDLGSSGLGNDGDDTKSCQRGNFGSISKLGTLFDIDMQSCLSLSLNFGRCRYQKDMFSTQDVNTKSIKHDSILHLSFGQADGWQTW
jgi:hypothetical protein